MATNLPFGSFLTVTDNEGELRAFEVHQRINKGHAATVYAGRFVGAEDDAPAILARDNEDGTGELV